jgi:hypothetical protein
VAIVPPKAARRKRVKAHDHDRRPLRRRQRRLLDHIANRPASEREDPMITASNNHYEWGRRAHGLAAGGLGALLLAADHIIYFILHYILIIFFCFGVSSSFERSDIRGIQQRTAARVGPTTPTRAVRGCLWPSGGRIGFDAAAPYSLLNDCHPRPVNAYQQWNRKPE